MDEEFKKLNEIWSAYQNEISKEEKEKIIDRLIEVELEIRSMVERDSISNPGQG